MKKVKPVRQHDLSDCGAACLSSVFSFYGKSIPIGRIRQYASTDQRGTNVLGLMDAAEKSGFQARGVRCNHDLIMELPLPSVVHVVLQSGLHHYLVLFHVGKKYVRYMDPADGRNHKVNRIDFFQIWSGVAVLIVPKADFKAEKFNLSVLSRFRKLIRPHARPLTAGFLGAIIYTLLGFSSAIFIRKLVDDVIPSEDIRLLHTIGILMIVLLVLQICIGLIKTIIGTRTGQLIDAQLISGYYRHLFDLPGRFFDTMRVGEISSRLGDAVKIRLLINDLFLNILVNLLIVCFSICIMFFYYWKLALMIVMVIPVYLILYLISNQYNHKWQRVLMERAADMENNFVEALQCAATVKQLNLNAMVIQRIEQSFFKLLKTGFRTGIRNLYISTTTEFVNRFLIIGVLWAGAYFVIRRELSAGELLSFYSLTGYLLSPVAMLIGAGKPIQDAMIAADRLFEIIDLEAESSAVQAAVHIEKHHLEDIHFNHVDFRYGSQSQIFTGLNLCIRKGSITAFVGESGSGKSSLVSLLLKTYQPKSGSICIGSLDISLVDAESLRALIGIVPQQIDLFSGTIWENIAIGDPFPNLEKVISLSREVGLDGFISSMPEGYFSKVGEKGTNLSGGQKQKLAIARALYKDPEVLILDEATANLDSISEKCIHSVIGRLKNEGKTIIIIAHRLSSFSYADNIHVLKNGYLVESGSHEFLLQNGGHYAVLWQLNKGG